MRYISTRGAAPAVDFTTALLGGLAPDGGLYVPQIWPSLSASEIATFAGAPYARVAADILGHFVGDAYSPSALHRICQEAYASFSHPAVTPLTQLAPDQFLLELFHGPTLAFKDVAMQLLARLYEPVLAARGQSLTIVCATSGDTGGAAVEAFAGRANVRIVALFPEGRISEVQRRFMTTAAAPNVRCVAVDGDFDDCQAILKSLFLDTVFAQEVCLSAVNSINFARILAQSVYYFVAAAALGAPVRSVSFAVPTGNFGDAFAGWAAKKMGLPITRIIASTNRNDIVARALQSGIYARGEAVATQSPAMDIQVASNFERLYFESNGRDGGQTRNDFDDFAASGHLQIPSQVLSQMQQLFVGTSVDEATTTQTLGEVWTETGRLIEPHTAVALAGARVMGHADRQVPVIVLSTAHPAKFPDTVREATGVMPPAPLAARAIAQLPERFDRLPAQSEAVKAYVRAMVAA